MKARTRRLYLVLIGAFAVAAGQEFGSLHAFASRGSLVYAQPLPPTVPSQSVPAPAAHRGGSPGPPILERPHRRPKFLLCRLHRNSLLLWRNHRPRNH